ncbi:MAG: hypothetical protein K1000chlam4_00115 [Chlamydiae bacterium]|nr:hypothetical protein [Chlamydiota bacterium]
MDTDVGKTINGVTEVIIGCAYRIANILGHGFLEKVYENALAHELKKEGCKFEKQKIIPVNYDGTVIGNYVADMMVENSVLVELKTVKLLDNIHIAQCLNYLKATEIPVCLLLNFGLPKVEVKRIVNHF